MGKIEEIDDVNEKLFASIDGEGSDDQYSDYTGSARSSADLDENDDEDFTDLSDADDDVDSDNESVYSVADESLLDRLSALKDIIPPGVRSGVSDFTEQVVDNLWSIGKIVGAAGWIVSTSAIMVALPMVLEMQKDMEIEEIEKQQRQQMAAQAGLPGAPGVMAPQGGGGVPSLYPQGAVPLAASPTAQAISQQSNRPPGF
ncbi:hypothetical protein GQ42DRAFT_160540 [Ramicandelaber brevisporus]|nr:hypothetical protein GQ42DRAFT_160540 [Ramicandelaber brevisporus]